MISLKEKYYLVNENGEIINEIDTKEGDRIIVDRKKERDNKIRTKEYLAETSTMEYSFVKINVEAVEKVTDLCPMAFKLFRYVGYLDNILKFSNGVLINQGNVEKIIGGSKEYVRRLIVQMQDLDIIRKHGRGNTAYFVVNPWICSKGKRVSKLALEEFKDSEWRGDVLGDNSIQETES